MPEERRPATLGRSARRGRHEVPVVAAEVLAGDARDRDDAVVDLLVDRLHPLLGGNLEQLRARAVEVLAVFAGARVRTFVPILAEKRLRRLYAGAPPPA
jgi:hypothetical protein